MVRADPRTERVKTPSPCDLGRAFTVHVPELQEDPFPLLAELRSRCPIAWSDAEGGFWVISRYEDARFVLQHPELFSSRQHSIAFLEDELGPLLPDHVDAPDHMRYRQLLLRAFAPDSIRRLEHDVRATARQLLEPLARRHEWDFMAEYAVPLPSAAFLRMLGLPGDELDRFVAWKDEIMSAGFSVAEGEAERSLRRALGEVLAFFSRRFRMGPHGEADGGLIDVLLSARLDGSRPLDENEFLRLVIFLFLAGLDTVASQLGLVVDYLGRHLDQRDLLVQDPSRIPTAVEELIRYETLGSSWRTVRTPVSVSGVAMQPGQRVLVVLPSANRDDAEFPGAQHVDFGRSTTRHLGFGAGPHRCLGSHLARMEMIVALEELHRMVPSYRVDSRRSGRRTFTLVRGIDRVHLRVDAGS